MVIIPFGAEGHDHYCPHHFHSDAEGHNHLDADGCHFDVGFGHHACTAGMK